MASEKITDSKLLDEFQKVFGCYYNTEGNNKLFGSKIPDGHFIFNNNIVIIENKKLTRDLKNALKQALKYYDLVKINNNFDNYWLVIGTGTILNFDYVIYKVENDKPVKTDKRIKDLKNNFEINLVFDKKIVHKFNQYMYDNNISLPKSQKTLFVASILLCLKINPNFLKDFDSKINNYTIADKMIQTINEYYKDVVFTNSFEFIKGSLTNKHLFKLFSFLTNYSNIATSDILKDFYEEFMKWDKNNESSLGIVLTPHDIVQIMVNNLHIQESDSVLDCCTGTGSFLLETGKSTKKLFGCENNEERYALAKCNFILNNYDISHLYHNNCFDQYFEQVDKVILNPPFNVNSDDDSKIDDILGWRDFKKEQKFVLYLLQHLKENGIGCFIIPRNNFNNSTKASQLFKQKLIKNFTILKIINCNSKVFAPVASVECTICVVQKKIIKNYETEIIDYSDDGFVIKDKFRIKNKEANIKNYKKILKLEDDWNYQIQINDKIDIKLIIEKNELEKYKNEIDERIKYIKSQIHYYNGNNNDQYEEFLLKDIIEPIKIKTFTYDKCEDGDIPFYVASKFYQPKGFKNVISIDCDKLKLDAVLTINKSGEGVVGYCFKRSGKFACNGLVGVYKMKKNLTDIDIRILQEQLIANLNHHFLHFSIQHLNTLKIYLPKERIEGTTFENYEERMKIIYDKIDKIKVKEWKKIRIGDYFDLVKNYKTFLVQNSESGNYPLITRSGENNGITKYINDYSLDGEYITIAPSGSSGTTFYHNYKFAVDKMLKVYKLKENKHKLNNENNINLGLFALMCNYKLTKLYSYNNGLTIEKIND